MTKKTTQTAQEVQSRISEIDGRVDELTRRINSVPTEMGESLADGDTATADKLARELSESRQELEALQAERNALDGRLPALRQVEAKPGMDRYKEEAMRLTSRGAEAAGKLESALESASAALDELMEIASESRTNAGSARQLARRSGLEAPEEAGIVRIAGLEYENRIRALAGHDALRSHDSLSPFRPIFVNGDGQKN